MPSSRSSKMRRTLLLVFIHGFKGGDQTFQNFPQDLRALLQHTLPLVDVVSAVYPAYETRGDLGECVGRFTEWLQNQVLDIEVANDSRAPTTNPSVHVVLCGHSMGGIVAAETLLKVARDHAVPDNSPQSPSQPSPSFPHSPYNATEPSFPSPAHSYENDTTKASSQQQGNKVIFFPNIRAILAFDTPYLGISPGVLAHGAEEQIAQASSAYKAWDSASQFFGKSGWGASKNSAATGGASSSTTAKGFQLPFMRGGGGAGADVPATTSSAAATESGANAAAGVGGWARWGRYAAYGGAAAAALAGAAGAAYISRDHISQGFAWAGSHLEFVGCLARGAELQKRVERVVELGGTHGVGFADFYTALGEKAKRKKEDEAKRASAGGAGGGGFNVSSYASASGWGEERTFCVVPRSARDSFGPSPTTPTTSSSGQDDHSSGDQAKDEGEKVQAFAADASRSKGLWAKCVNDAASDEVSAHTSMFTPADNPDYHDMLPRARDWIAEWVDRGWYQDFEGS